MRKGKENRHGSSPYRQYLQVLKPKFKCGNIKKIIIGHRSLGGRGRLMEVTV
jgi:hypothetical protein